MDRRAQLSNNSRIAVALIDVLLASSDRTAARRAIQAAGGEEAVSALGKWLPEETLAVMFRAVAAETRLPQRVGRALVSSPRAGLFLRYSGVATPEKAYRRCDQLLAREERGALYEVAKVVGGRARILFHPAERASTEAFYCSLRAGMLEAVPTVYGLLPAKVREKECVRRGAPCCVYDVRWSRSSQGGLVAGAFAGTVSGAMLAALLGAPLWSVPLAALAAGALSAAAGRSVDLARQLEAVAGARRGQLALLDQADRSLAEKMDQFARLEAADCAGGDGRPPRIVGLPGFDEAGADAIGAATPEFQLVDLSSLVRRAVDSQQAQLLGGPPVRLDLPEDPVVLDGEPIQLEMVVVQLLRNAATAAHSQAESAGQVSGSIRVSLHDTGESLELAVEDDGPGIEEETVDEVFDPFVGRPGARGQRGLGLAAAYRVVEEHGGELRLESAQGHGTRVTALLPRRRASCL